MMNSHRFTKNRLVVLLLALSFTGCSDNVISGTYRDTQNPAGVLQLNHDGTFFLVSGYTGKYSVKEKRIRLEDPVFGSAEGGIASNTLVFSGKEKTAIGPNVAGTWVKQ
jgi:hypothetical protein